MNTDGMVKWIVLGLLAAILAAALGLVMAFPIMWLWNGFFPVVLGTKSINWTQALYLYVLCRVLLITSSNSSK